MTEITFDDRQQLYAGEFVAEPFRPLTQEEMEIASDTPGVVVTAPYRLSKIFDTANAFRWAADQYEDPGSSSQPTPPCWWDMDNDARIDSITDDMADKVLDEIKKQPNQNMEYGAVIFVNAFGNLEFSPLRPSASFTTQLDVSVLPKKSEGTTDYSSVLGLVHSHPRSLPGTDGSLIEYYNPLDMNYLLSPSIRDDMPDDWFVYDQIKGFIDRDGGDSSQFSMYIAGYNGIGLVLNEFGEEDRESEDGEGDEPVPAGYISPLNTDC